MNEKVGGENGKRADVLLVSAEHFDGFQISSRIEKLAESKVLSAHKFTSVTV